MYELPRHASDHQDFHLLRVEVLVTNHSTSRLEVSTAEYPPFVIVYALPDGMLSNVDPSHVDFAFTEDLVVAGTSVMKGQFVESAETLVDACLLPVRPRWT
jgi:hypothetical protein